MNKIERFCIPALIYGLIVGFGIIGTMLFMEGSLFSILNGILCFFLSITIFKITINTIDEAIDEATKRDEPRTN